MAGKAKRPPIGPSRPRAELVQLDRALLHVFVAGPGEGEAIAVALPKRGWLLFDGCRSGDGSVALVDILETWRTDDDPIHAYVLTHPHSDHAKGIIELFERFGPDIERIAVSPPWLSQGGDSAITSRQILGKRVERAMARLRRARKEGTRYVKLVAGCALVSKRKDIRVRVCCPPENHTKSKKCDPNELSAVVEIGHGQCRIVLGSDLPDRLARRKGGWHALLKQRPALGAHSVLKIPHHGSETARSQKLFALHAGDRAWTVTPYNSSNLPDAIKLTGLAWIVGRGKPVHLTAPPVSKKVQTPVTHPGVVQLAQLRERIADAPTGIPLLDRGAVEVTPRALSARDSLWCFAVNAAGHVTGRWRGEVALEVVP